MKHKCSYPNCNKPAEVTLGMADPDGEQVPYCKKHADIVKINTFMELFKMQRVKK